MRKACDNQGTKGGLFITSDIQKGPGEYTNRSSYGIPNNNVWAFVEFCSDVNAPKLHCLLQHDYFAKLYAKPYTFEKSDQLKLFLFLMNQQK